MESWVKLHDRLYVNLDTGVCGHTASSNRQEKRVRLTRGQRKVFHALVMKEGRLCTLDSLEMLFDDSNEGYPSIKNYIHGIKTTLKKQTHLFVKRSWMRCSSLSMTQDIFFTFRLRES